MKTRRTLTRKQMWLYIFFLSLVVILFGMVLGMAQNVLAADGNYLTFTGENSAFTLSTRLNEQFWDGKLEYSTDTIDWQIWDGTAGISSTSSAPYVLYLRGENNSYVGDKDFVDREVRKSLILSAPAACSGNNMTLLEYRNPSGVITSTLTNSGSAKVTVNVN